MYDIPIRDQYIHNYIVLDFKLFPWYPNEVKNLKIALIAGGFKPFTAGHSFLINKASSECDTVFLFASMSDRIRKNQHPITWKQMEPIWASYILPNLQQNVCTIFCKNPTEELFNLLIEANEAIVPTKTYICYTDDKDVSYISSDRVLKNFENLIQRSLLKYVSVNRGTNIDVSGTLMRESIKNDNFAQFESILPEYMQFDSKKIFQGLKNGN